MVSLGFVNVLPNGAFKRLRLLQRTPSAVVPGGSPQLIDFVSGPKNGLAINTGAFLTLFENGYIGGHANSTHPLPNGTQTNQLKLIRHVAASTGTGVVTITSNKLKGGTQITLSLNGLSIDNVLVGLYVLLKWSGTQWVLVDQSSTAQITLS